MCGGRTCLIVSRLDLSCHRGFQQWAQDGTPRRGLERLAAEPRATGELEATECLIDGTFAAAKKAVEGGQDKQGKGTKLMAMAASAGLPVAVYTSAACCMKSPLFTDAVVEDFTCEQPHRQSDR